MNEIIHPNSEFGQIIGFTSNKFSGWLWRDNGRIVFSFLISKHPNQGNLSTLIKTIEDMGLRVAVSAPLGKMSEYLAKRNFVPHIEEDPQLGGVEIWERSPAYLGVENQPQPQEEYQHFKGNKYRIMTVSNSVWIPPEDPVTYWCRDSETTETLGVYHHDYGVTLTKGDGLRAITAPHVIYYPVDDISRAWARELNNFLSQKDGVDRFTKI